MLQKTTRMFSISIKPVITGIGLVFPKKKKKSTKTKNVICLLLIRGGGPWLIDERNWLSIPYVLLNFAREQEYPLISQLVLHDNKERIK